MSVCNLRYKVVFIHVPKAAGSSMETREFIGGQGHQTIEWLKGQYDRGIELGVYGLPAWEDLFKFGFVRNPYTRFASAVAHAARFSGQTPLMKKLRAKEYLSPETFTWFAVEREREIREIESGDPGDVFLPQHRFLCIPANSTNLEVDFVGRFENLLRDWAKVCDRVGVHDFLYHLLPNRIANPSRFYTPEAREVVARLYAKDFELFGYEV